MKTTKSKPNIVSVHLAPRSKQDLDAACDARGMTIKSLLGRLIEWFVSLDKTEQSIVLGQVEESDVKSVAEIIAARRQSAAKPVRKRPDEETR